MGFMGIARIKDAKNMKNLTKKYILKFRYDELYDLAIILKEWLSDCSSFYLKYYADEKGEEEYVKFIVEETFKREYDYLIKITGLLMEPQLVDILLDEISRKYKENKEIKG